MFIAAHEQLISEYMSAHPLIGDEQAYTLTADAAWVRMRENMADMADYDRRKEG